MINTSTWVALLYFIFDISQSFQVLAESTVQGFAEKQWFHSLCNDSSKQIHIRKCTVYFPNQVFKFRGEFFPFIPT